jgi:hypothetical protein
LDQLNWQPNQDFLNGPVKDCLGQSYTDRFKTKRRFITKNANIAKMQLYKETTGVSVFKLSTDKL